MNAYDWNKRFDALEKSLSVLTKDRLYDLIKEKEKAAFTAGYQYACDKYDGKDDDDPNESWDDIYDWDDSYKDWQSSQIQDDDDIECWRDILKHVPTPSRCANPACNYRGCAGCWCEH